MLKKLVQNQKKYVFFMFLGSTGIFLLLTTFSFYWLTNMVIAGIYIAFLLVIRAYSKGGVPSLAVGLATWGYLLVWSCFLLIIFNPLELVNRSERSSIITTINTILLVIWVVGKVPQAIKRKVTKALVDRGLADVSSLPLIKPYTPPTIVTYRDYKKRRWQQITRYKPHYFRNQSERNQTIRVSAFMFLWAFGGMFLLYGLTEYYGGPFIWSSYYWLSVGGFFLCAISLPALLSGLKFTLITATITSSVLMGSTLIIQWITVLFSGNETSFYLAIIALFMSLGVALAFWIRMILMEYTNGMMMYVRNSVWINVELLMLECLPIKNFEHMILVDIQGDDRFDLAKLMKLGSQIELFAHYRRMIFTGIRFDPKANTIELFFLTKNPVYAKRTLTRFFKRHFHYPMTVSVLNDLKTTIDSQLAPTEIELLEARNRNAVLHYEHEKVDFNEVHSIVVVLTFSEDQQAQNAAKKLFDEGYTNQRVVDYRKYQDEPANDWNGWHVVFLQIETRIGLDRINILTRNIRELILPNFGYLSRWFLGTIKQPETDIKGENQPE